MKRTIQLAESASMHRLSVTEAVDPKLFGELRSLLASPYKGLRQGKTFLRHVAEMLSQAYEQDADEADEVLLPYAVQAVSRLPDDQRWITVKDVDAIFFAPLRKRQKLLRGAAKFMEKTHEAITQPSSLEWVELDGLTASDLSRIKIGKAESGGLGFTFNMDVSKFLDELPLVRQAIDMAAEGHEKVYFHTTGRITATGVSRFIQSIAPAMPPNIKNLIILLNVSGLNAMRRRTGGSAIGAILDRLAQRPSALQVFNGRLTIELFSNDYIFDGDDMDAAREYSEASILSGYDFTMSNQIALTF